jgi:hypothetical protein
MFMPVIVGVSMFVSVIMRVIVGMGMCVLVMMLMSMIMGMMMVMLVGMVMRVIVIVVVMVFVCFTLTGLFPQRDRPHDDQRNQRDPAGQDRDEKLRR